MTRSPPTLRITFRVESLRYSSSDLPSLVSMEIGERSCYGLVGSKRNSDRGRSTLHMTSIPYLLVDTLIFRPFNRLWQRIELSTVLEL